MSKTQDAYSNGVYVSLTCSQCLMVVTTPNGDEEICPITLSDQWKSAHEDYNRGNNVARFVDYVA